MIRLLSREKRKLSEKMWGSGARVKRIEIVHKRGAQHYFAEGMSIISHIFASILAIL